MEKVKNALKYTKMKKMGKIENTTQYLPKLMAAKKDRGLENRK